MRPILFGLLFGGALGFVIGNSFGAWRVREKMRKAFRDAIKVREPSVPPKGPGGSSDVIRRSRLGGLRVVGRTPTPPPPSRPVDEPTVEIPYFKPGQARP